MRLLMIIVLLAMPASLVAQSVRPTDSAIQIRRLDRVYRKEGKPLDVIITTQGDWQTLDKISVTSESQAASYTISVSDIESIVPRQSPEQIYASWQRWLSKNHRERKLRAKAELELALWCLQPHPDNDGEPPNAVAALLHFEKAARLDPSLHEVYPYLVDLYSRRHSVETATDGEINREVETWMLAATEGYSSNGIDYRLGLLLARRFDRPADAIAYLSRLLESEGLNAGRRREARALLSEALFRSGDPGRAIALYEGMIPPEDLVPFPEDGGPGDEEAAADESGGTSKRVAPPSAGEDDDAEIVEPTPAETAARFEAYYRLARMRLRLGGTENLSIARGLLRRAQQIQPDFDDIWVQLAIVEYHNGRFQKAVDALETYLDRRPVDVGAAVDLALAYFRLGNFGEVEAILDRIAEIQALSDAGSTSPGADPDVAGGDGVVSDDDDVVSDDDDVVSDEGGGSEVREPGGGGAFQSAPHAWRIALVRGLVAEARGDDAAAAAAYRDSLDSSTNEVLPGLLLAAAQLRNGDVAVARGTVEALQRTFSERRDVFAAVSRLQATIELGESRSTQAAKLLEYAADVDRADGALLERAALTFLHAGDAGKAGALLAEAHKLSAERAANLNGLGYLFYLQRDLDEAKRYFDRTVAGVGEDATEEALGQKRYAQEILATIRDIQSLEVWSDTFDGGDSQQVDGWDKAELFGVSISRRGSAVVFSGTQKNSANGLTELRLRRGIDAPSFERLSVRVRLDSGTPQPMLRLETPGSARRGVVGLLVLRDVDGLVKAKVRAAAGAWKEPAKTAPDDRGRTSYQGGVPWTTDEAFHTFEIRKSERKWTRGRYFDVYFDDQPVALELPVSELIGAEYRAVVSGATDALGNDYAFTADDLKIYRRAKQK